MKVRRFAFGEGVVYQSRETYQRDKIKFDPSGGVNHFLKKSMCLNSTAIGVGHMLIAPP